LNVKAEIAVRSRPIPTLSRGGGRNFCGPEWEPSGEGVQQK